MNKSLMALPSFVFRFQEAFDRGSDFDIEKLPDLRDKNNILERGKRFLFSDQDSTLLPRG